MIYRTADRLPPQRADRKNYKVLAREHGKRHWNKVDWSRVTKKDHAEWRPLSEGSA